MRALIFDTETTDTGPDAKLVQAAWIEIDGHYRGGPVVSNYYNPGKPISFGAMATHHITDEDVADCVPASEFRLPDNVDYLIGHKIDFDWEVIGKPDVRRICTLALARSAWPEADSHAQGALMYYLKRPEAKEMLRDAHSAAVDVQICEIILRALRTWFVFPALPRLWELSEEARVPKVMPFGKHKGTPISMVPRDYRQWLLRQDDVDPYLRKALET